MRAAELEGAELDAAVAKAEGLRFRVLNEAESPIGRVLTVAWPAHHAPTMSAAEEYEPSTDWAVGGPIIERERLNVVLLRSGEWWAEPSSESMQTLDGVTVAASSKGESGPTPLIAAMRAYVASRFGDEVEL